MYRLLFFISFISTAFSTRFLISQGDRHLFCCYWAANNECLTNPVFMRSQCQKSCGTFGCTGVNALECNVRVNIRECPFNLKSVKIWSKSDLLALLTDNFHVGSNNNQPVSQKVFTPLPTQSQTSTTKKLPRLAVKAHEFASPKTQLYTFGRNPNPSLSLKPKDELFPKPAKVFFTSPPPNVFINNTRSVKISETALPRKNNDLPQLVTTTTTPPTLPPCRAIPEPPSKMDRKPYENEPKTSQITPSTMIKSEFSSTITTIYNLSSALTKTYPPQTRTTQDPSTQTPSTARIEQEPSSATPIFDLSPPPHAYYTPPADRQQKLWPYHGYWIFNNH